jgi:hypothetical protein
LAEQDAGLAQFGGDVVSGAMMAGDETPDYIAQQMGQKAI